MVCKTKILKSIIVTAKKEFAEKDQTLIDYLKNIISQTWDDKELFTLTEEKGDSVTITGPEILADLYDKLEAIHKHDNVFDLGYVLVERFDQCDGCD